MNKPRIKLIMNPNADMGNAWRYAADLRHLFEGVAEADWTGTVYPSHAQSLAKQAAEEGYEIVVAIGGDGTAHEVINGLMEVPAEKRPIFGVIPLGSGNDFCANVGNTKDPDKVAKAILAGYTKTVDIASVEDESGRMEYWGNTINIGFGGSVTIFFRTVRFLRGFPRYILTVLKVIFSNYIVMKNKIKMDGKEFETETIMIALNNGPREGGGFHTGPKAIMDDGELDITIVEKVSRLKMLMLLIPFMNGTQEKDRAVSMDRFKKIEIESDKPMYLHADGELFAGLNHDVHYLKVEVLPQALEVIVPEAN
ncbi:MAG: diacylglycerol kinase family lipid kinase [Anaerolineales bacterium]|nr:diacylglycerol kinase family lipid kinase [Anaerolineales bacterium]